MKRLHTVLAAPVATFFAALVVMLAALPAQAKSRDATPKIDYEKYTLPNGLEVILSEDHRLPLVAVNLWYHVGPANERPGRTGFAHLFEHMMFQGSGHIPEDSHFKLLEAAGATDINGTTGFDRTNYYATLPSDRLELALWLESDRMGFLLDTLDQSMLSNQQDVVRNERRQSIESQPYGLADEAVFRELFPEGHPYRAAVIGSHADIEAAQLDDVRDFFRQYYVPNNATLAIVGDIDRARTKQLVEKYFGTLKRGPDVPRVDVKTPPITSERRAVVTDRVELPRVYMTWLTPAYYAPGDAEADLLAVLLGGGKSSRLYKKLVYELQIAQDVSASQHSMALGSTFGIEATAKPGVTAEALEKAIDAELATLRATGPQPSEFLRARNTIESQIVQSLETVGGVADRLNQYEHYLKDPGYLAKDLERYRAATLDGVRGIAGLLVPEHRLVVHAVPGNKVLNDVPSTRGKVAKSTADRAPSAEPWRVQIPPAGPASKLALPVPKRFVLRNGLQVLLVEQHNLPIVAANLVVLSGSDANPAGKPGLASFTADMLDEGTTTRSTLQIADELAALGAYVGSGSSSDASSVALRSLTRNVDAAFPIFADVALSPAFDAKEIERVRGTRRTQLLQQRDNPAAIAARVLNRALYGSRHPYGYLEIGTEASIDAISRADMQAFWRAGFAPRNAALVLAGDMDLRTAKRLAERYFGRWQGSAATLERPAPPAAPERRIILVDRPAAPQTALRLGQIAVPRAHPDYVPLELLNASVGGLFSSRINMNLREQHGYTYGAGSAFAWRRGPGPFFVATGVSTDVTAPALHEIFVELERIKAEPPNGEELDLARDSFARSLPGLFETNAAIAASTGQIYVHSLPLDYFRKLPAQIAAATAADVARVAKEQLDPAHMVVVAVGDRATIEQPLRELGAGAIEIRDAKGDPLAAEAAPTATTAVKK